MRRVRWLVLGCACVGLLVACQPPPRQVLLPASKILQLRRMVKSGPSLRTTFYSYMVKRSLLNLCSRPAAPIADMTTGPDGRMWLIGDRGIAVYDPAQDKQP
jgi:hypothetical protein